MGNCVGRLPVKDRGGNEVTPWIPWRKSRFQSGLESTLAGPIKLRSLLRDPDERNNAASEIKYKDKTVDWISEHYRTRLSVHKGEYKLEAALAETIVADFCQAGWKIVMYEYKLHRWDGDLVFVRDEAEDEPVILVVEAKVLTGVYHDKTKFAKVVQQTQTYWQLARSLFHQNCKVYAVPVLNIRLHGEFDLYQDRLFIAKRGKQLIPQELLDTLPVDAFVNSLSALHDAVPVLKQYVPPPKKDTSNRKGGGSAAGKKKSQDKPQE